VLPIPDRDAVVGVRGDEPGVSGVELDLHDFVARRPERPQAEHLAAAAACCGGVVASERRAGTGAGREASGVVTGKRQAGAGVEIWSLEIWG